MSFRLLAVGEVAWDLQGDEEHIGGAPFNLAAHVARLGGAASILTRIGRDARGVRALRVMRQIGVDPTFVQRDRRHATGWARVEIGVDGSPAFTLPRNPAYRHIAMTAPVLRRLLARGYDAIAFGTWQQAGRTTRRTLHAVLRHAAARVVLYDVNIRMDFYPRRILHESLRASTVVKLNADEVSQVARRLYGPRLGEAGLAVRLMRDYPVRVVCVTKGADGCTVHVPGESRTLPAPAVKVADTVGAGDAFSAAFLFHYFHSGDPFAAARRGNQLGAYVASCTGAVPANTASIRRALIR